VVILVKIDLQSKKVGRIVLFSTDLELEAATIPRYYSLRFQIEFNFRDAKQYFGLADLKNVKEQQVEDAVNLAFFMDNVSLVLLEQSKSLWQQEYTSIQDLKAHFRAEKYLHDILNTLEIDEKTILNHPQLAAIRQIGAVNKKKNAA
jgi:putative transposase